MEKINDGGPAFPHAAGKDEWVEEGMTLRDYFAAKALPSVYEEYVMDAREEGFAEDWKMGVALDAYAMADAMLRAREAI